MALQFIDGFDHYVTADLNKKGWNPINGAGFTIAAGTGRRGGGALTYSGNTLAECERGVPQIATYVIGFAYKTSALSGALAFLSLLDNGTRQLALRFNASGTISALRGGGGGTVLGTSTNALLTSTYYYVELKTTISPTVGTVEVRVNGDPWLVLTNQNTRTSANNYATTLRVGCDVNNSVVTTSMWYDDFYLLDTTGTANNDFLGDCRVDALYPVSDGTYSSFTPSAGTSHYSLLNESAPDSTTYVSSSTVGGKDSYHFGALPVTGNVFAVQINNCCMKDDAGTRTAANLVRSGTSELQGAASGLPTSFTYKSSIHETDPATGGAWTATGVNAAEFGMVVVT